MPQLSIKLGKQTLALNKWWFYSEHINTLFQDWFMSICLNKCLLLVCDQINLPRRIAMLQLIIVLTHLAKEIRCRRVDQLVQQNWWQPIQIEEPIVVCIALKSDWIDALTSHDVTKSNNMSQLVMFDLISFIDDSFHLARPVDKNFLNIWQRNKITPIEDMGRWVQFQNRFNSEQTNHCNVINERANKSIKLCLLSRH